MTFMELFLSNLPVVRRCVFDSGPRSAFASVLRGVDAR
jgi:hypothetical protein